MGFPSASPFQVIRRTMSISPSTFLSKVENEVPLFPNSCSVTICGTRSLCAKAVLEAKTASTLNLEDQLSTNPKVSVSNPDFPGTMFLITTSQLLPKLLNCSIEPPSADCGVQNFIQMDLSIFITWRTGGSAETRDQLVGDVVDHRAKTVNTHYKKFWCPLMMDVAVAVYHAHFFFYHGITNQTDIGVAFLRTFIPVMSQTQSQFSSLLDVLMLHACCMPCCYRMIMSIHSPNHTPLSFNGGGGVVNA